MNLRIFTRLIAFLAGSLAVLSSCNSDNTYDGGELSSDGQINNFRIASIMTNATDSATYPSMPTTRFTIINDGQFLIFNVDSLPQHTEIRTLKVNATYTSTPSRIDLIYKGLDGLDSIPETSWNSSDSVKFFKEGTSGRYLPDFNVVAPDGTVRRYTITFNIHTTDPDSIRWTRVERAPGLYFDLLKEGENKTVINSDSTLFYSLTNSATKVYIYSSNVTEDAPEWKNLKETDLPANILVESLQLVDGYFVVGAKDGKVYTSSESGNLEQWTAYTTNNVTALLGSFVDLQDPSKSDLLFIVKKTDGTSVFAKAKAGDIDNITELSQAGSTGDLVSARFPVAGFSAVSGAALGLDNKHIIVTGGTDSENRVVNRSWMIREISADKIQVAEGFKDNLTKYDLGVTTFAYNSKMYMVANDSMYTSIGYGDNWIKVDKKQAFEKKMIENGMDKPSVIIDKDNFIWIFGGKFKTTTTNYSKTVWRGRLNKLTHKRFN